MNTRKLSVTFERKLDVGQYQNVVARAWLEDTLSADATAEEVSKALGDAFSQVKAAVYDELGIEVLMDDAGVIREKHEPTVTRTEQRLGQELGATPVNSGGGFQTKGLEVAGDLLEDIPDFVVDVCRDAGVTKVWANNGKFGPFYKEFVPKGETPKLGVDNQGRSVIITAPK